MGMMDAMMENMMNRMSKEDREAMMDKMMCKFFEGMTREDKQKMMQDMMPKMMEGMTMMDMMSGMMGAGGEREGMMGMMSGMMGEQKGNGITPMARMMEQMLPHCLSMMLPHMPKENRADFSVKLIKSLMEKGAAGLTEEEKKEYLNKILEAVRMTAAPA
jgi:hypothetical protein